jgi:FkbH-like protein
MSPSIHSNLTWLPEAPADFNSRCRDLLSDAAEGSVIGRELRTLSNFRLNEIQLFLLGQTMDRLKRNNQSTAPLADFTLGLLCNGTSNILAPILKASAIRHGFAMEVVRGDYGQVMQDAQSPESAINNNHVHAVLISVDYRWFPFRTCPGQAAETNRVVEACVEQIQAVRSGIKARSKVTCIIQTLAPPVEGLFGNLDRALPGTLRHLIDSVNVELSKMVLGSDDLLLDVSGLAEIVGLAEWHNPHSWNVAKIPFDQTYLPLYADHVARLIGALWGKSRRCLILDLDNTVWGGVIGDDGVDGIRVAQGDAIGEAHLEIQRTALALRGRGVLLAVASKNTDDVARKPFLHHPEMLLQLDHIASFQANWNDKPANIRAIGDELALGLESMVFLDDSPMERTLVRRVLPEVAVPELPTDPALYARTLIAAGYFEAVRFSNEDTQRAEHYQNNSRRIELQREARDVHSYLDSLNMTISIQPFDATGRARIAQLISKSNQFNLTGRRYSAGDLAALEDNPEILTMQIRLQDIFGDNGMISVVICRHVDPEALELDTWVMSCRVLGRYIERAVLQEVINYARNHQIQRIIGRFVPSDRNEIVMGHYGKLGFQKVETLNNGTAIWELKVAAVGSFKAPIRTVSSISII